jgi:hypothetical protein
MSRALIRVSIALFVVGTFCAERSPATVLLKRCLCSADGPNRQPMSLRTPLAL